jgi:lysylphosphatidylglycerol synthetase-like protein (DUF2156 family)
MRVALALTVAAALLALWRLMRPGHVTWQRWDDEARSRYIALGGAQSVDADGVVWGESERSGVAFRRIGQVLLGLGDPAGMDRDRVSAIWRLRDLARQEGLQPAFWGAGPEFLPVYGDLGLIAVALSSDGHPHLSPLAGTQGARTAGGRYLVYAPGTDLAAISRSVVGPPPARLVAV